MVVWWSPISTMVLLGSAGGLVGQLGQPPFEKPPLRLLLGEGEGPLVGRPGLRGPAQPPAQVCARGVCQAVFLQIAASENRVDQAPGPPQGHRASPPLRRGSARPRARVGAQQHIVQPDDLRPSPSHRRWALGRARPRSPPEACTGRSAATQRSFHQRRPFGDLVPIPERAVLVVQQHQFAGGEVRAARRDSCSSISASSPIASGSGSSSTSSRPRRIASPDRSTRVSDAPDDAA